MGFRHASASVLGGALVAVANLWMLGKIVMAFASAAPAAEQPAEATPAADANAAAVTPSPEDDAAHKASNGRVAAWSALALLKMLVLFGGAYQLMKLGVVAPLALVLGYSSLPIGITFAQLLGRLR
jgi:hypothetical protein